MPRVWPVSPVAAPHERSSSLAKCLCVIRSTSSFRTKPRPPFLESPPTYCQAHHQTTPPADTTAAMAHLPDNQWETITLKKPTKTNSKALTAGSAGAARAVAAGYSIGTEKKRESSACCRRA